jgi:hypothetical protein
MSKPDIQPEHTTPVLRWLLLAALPVLLHLIALPPNEPVFNGDANRHVMTSVFFRDFLIDLPLDHPKQYADDYYQQYPALGLMVWPPLFHGVSGLLMTVFGTSAGVPRLFVFACFIWSAFSLYRLCHRRISAEQSELVTVIYALMPMIFTYSRYIMLEMPTLALCLLAIERFDAWLQQQRTCNLYIAAIAAALAALTRFDAAVLLPILILTTLFQGQWKQLLTRHLPIAAVIAIILVGPTYAVIWRELGDLHIRQAVENVSPENAALLANGRVLFYPLCIPEQAGTIAAIFFLAGLGMAATAKFWRAPSAVFAAMLIGTYITFTPLAEYSPRHAIYWLPAVAYFASICTVAVADAIRRMTSWTSSTTATISYSIIICSVAWTTFFLAPYRVTGYADAANVALQHSEPGSRILIDGWWDGNITYHLRHLDSSRSRHIVRADKVLYDFTNVPTVDFQQFVETDTEILQAMADTQSSCIVFEDPQPFGNIAISERMHSLVKSMPQQFSLLKSIPVEIDFPGARQFDLNVFAVNNNQLQTYLNPIRQSTADPTKSILAKNKPQ